MSWKRKWNERTRMLLILELAIVLPAAALIGFSLYNLHTIERDEAVQAAIQRDFQYTLKSVEKRMGRHAAKLVEAVRQDFPCNEDKTAPVLDKVLKDHPYAAHVFLYDPEVGLTFRSRTGREGDEYFAKERERLSTVSFGWLKSEVADLVPKLRQMEEKGDEPYYVYQNWVPRESAEGYQAVYVFALPKYPANSMAVGGMIFDAEYLRDEFFPRELNEAVMDPLPGGGSHATQDAVIILRPRKEERVIAACSGWDGLGKMEVERAIEYGFPGLRLGMKLRGTTIAAISERFVRTNLLVIGGLSLLLAGGIFLTYRNVMREMQLARLKSDFVANVSHELRTPLALIRLYAETLEMGRLTAAEKFQEYYRIIRKESERLTSLINNILDFSRIEAGKKEYSFGFTNLGELVRQTLESYRFQIEQQGFHLEEKIADDLPPVRVDREAIARSLVNLVNNALKYSSKEKFLGVSLYRANGDVKLEVVDHGIGIPKSDLDRIFDKFYRVGDPLVHNTKGSGLGLTLVQHIVQAHGGKVSVESAPGKGSKFTIELPIPGRVDLELPKPVYSTQ